MSDEITVKMVLRALNDATVRDLKLFYDEAHHPELFRLNSLLVRYQMQQTRRAWPTHDAELDAYLAERR